MLVCLLSYTLHTHISYKIFLIVVNTLVYPNLITHPNSEN